MYVNDLIGDLTEAMGGDVGCLNATAAIVHNLLGENTTASSLSSEYGNVTGSALAQPVRVQHLNLGLALPADRRGGAPPPCSAPSPTTSQWRP